MMPFENKKLVVFLSAVLVFSASFAYADSQTEHQGLEVYKIVNNDNGGTKKPQDFSFNLETVNKEGSYNKQVIQFALRGDTYDSDIPIGTTFKITEDPSPDYDTKYVGDCSGIVKADSFCTVVNTYKSKPEFQGLSVYKIVNNDNGGTKKSQDFSFNLEVIHTDGTTSRQVIPFAFRGDTYDSDIPIGTTFKITEDPSPGYDTKYVGDCSGIVKADSFCTVVNNDKPLPEFQGLEIQKIVNNDNGGTKRHQDFSFNLETVNKDGSYNKQVIPFPYYDVYDSDIPIGTTFKITEDPSPDYDTSYVGDCSGIVKSNSHCTIVNSDKPISAQTTHTSIPGWIKNTARYWSDGSLSDKEFATGIGYLVQQKIISANVTTNKDGSILINDNLSIPKWIRINAQYWSKGSISDADFTSGIEYMVNQNIISFSEPSILSQISEPDKVVNSPSHPPVPLKVVNPIQLQSKHGAYELAGKTSFSGIDIYNIFCTWVLKSQNVEYKTAHVILTSSTGKSSEFDLPINDGVIQTNLSFSAGTYVFRLANIDGLSPPDDNTIEIVIPPRSINSGTPSTAQTTPVVPTTPLTQNSLEFTVPSQIVQEATSSSGAIVHFTTSFSSPGSSTDSTIITCNPTDGSQFPIGSTVVTCTATDIPSQKTLKKSFTVQVRDTTPPMINPYQPHNDTPDDSGAVVYFTISAVDLVDGPVTPHCNYESGTKFPIGVSTITCTADDSRGNHASRSLQIKITKS